MVSVLDVIPLELREHRQTGLKARVFHGLASRADVVLTLSHHSAGRISELLRIPTGRIIVAPLPVAPAFTPGLPADPSHHPGAYVAMLFDLRSPDPRKRTDWLPEIAELLRRQNIGVVVAGGGTETLSIPGVVGLGRIPDAEWASVLRGALALVYTSAYEGQGMPPLEAIACGTPVVAMANTAIPEVVGAAGVLIAESAGDSAPGLLAEAALRLESEPVLRAQLVRACGTQSDRFSPAMFAERLSGAYSQALEVS